MTDYPSESSLVVNATQQQLSRSGFNAGVAVIPTQHEEAEGGYDIEFETATRLELQYKAVYSEIDDRTFERGVHHQAVKFPFNAKQANTLLAREPPQTITFYALPVVTNLSGLGDILGSTVFIHVKAFETLPKPVDQLDEYSAFWVPVTNSTPTFSAVYLKDKTEPRYSLPDAYDRIPRQYLYTWTEVKHLTQAHQIGVPVRMHSSSTPTPGYQELRTYESDLLESRFPQSILDDDRPTQPANWKDFEEIVDEVVRRSREVAATIEETRPPKEETSPAAREILNAHPYLKDTTQESENRRAAIQAALLESPEDDTDATVPTIDYSGLDPRQGSHYRQYRYLAWGNEADTLTVPIGFQNPRP